MRGVVLPGVFRPRSDTWLLARAARAQRAGGRVLELCAGPAFAGIAAVLGDGARLTTVDVSRRAAANAWLNARLNGLTIDARRGDLLDAVPGERFDLILANPPYLPGPAPADRGRERAIDAGADGRAFLDRICRRAPAHLNRHGALLLVQSEVCGIDATLTALEAGGLEADVVARHRGPLGPLLRARRDELVSRGLLRPGQELEEVVVLRGRRLGRTGTTWPTPTP
jgi:release factor glutamine methyltransferase